MSIVVRVVAPELQKQIQLLDKATPIFNKHFSAAFRGAVNMAYYAIEPNIPRRTGKAAGSFRREVRGFGSSFEGEVGWFGGYVKAWYINIVEHGARSHSLVTGSKQRTKSARKKFEKRVERGTLGGAHVFINGNWVTMRVHPGFSKRGFMAAGYSAVKPLVKMEIARAAENALAEQAVK